MFNGDRDLRGENFKLVQHPDGSTTSVERLEHVKQFDLKAVWKDMWQNPHQFDTPAYREGLSGKPQYSHHFENDREHKFVILLKHFDSSGQPISAYQEVHTSNGLKSYEKIFEKNSRSQQFKQFCYDMSDKVKGLFHSQEKGPESHGFLSTEKEVPWKGFNVFSTPFPFEKQNDLKMQFGSEQSILSSISHKTVEQLL
jgi:hypothetical protein